ncbi:MAG TPA: hypothetical protein VGU61_21625 [Noviherbaspirillum sp.]|jgi:purine-binding chemotaxis protein CheW|nr:hypothetical protein [Noviherbaspirillum sp.]HEV2612874.1 hypothetical protein [Noviherbaspirillum sp.]
MRIKFGLDEPVGAETGAAISSSHLMGLGTVDERMLALIDINELMTSPDMKQVEKLSA